MISMFLLYTYASSSSCSVVCRILEPPTTINFPYWSLSAVAYLCIPSHHMTINHVIQPFAKPTNHTVHTHSRLPLAPTSPPSALSSTGINTRVLPRLFNLFLFSLPRPSAGAYVSSEGSPELMFLLVENYNYLTAPVGLWIGREFLKKRC